MQNLPTRMELHAIRSLTLTDRQFLLGEQEGQAATIAGLLSLAQGEGRQPVVVMVHGSGGMGPSIALWQRQVNAMGAAAFLLDGFTGRGLVSVAGNQGSLGRLAFILDIYRALAVLAAHPAIDATRIAVMGFSRGGQGALYAGMARFHQLWNPRGIAPIGTAAVYPDCGTRYIGDTVMLPAPLRVFHGRPDDFNPIGPARAHVARLRAAGHDADIIEYDDAHHGFDNPLSPSAALVRESQSVRDCVIEEREPGVLVNAVTGRPFSYDDPCVAHSVHVGGNAVAAAELRRDVLAWLRQLLRLS
ncbi:dienelactone hydrolase family protein [Falsiroseomonas stagni]|uniref:Dienelactone hydrolase n=1 Tax=Falsiroseomonas stagni DSM 19981 TaxID=1123062 RepID=A0A1I3ZQJ1_9PROT|nr:dienelactone hydrolase family protein [Falsiroseomonas stagni]SFK46150.1 Dienelactone hydrolase [Falsiroseomonas stagni DSM 19981]